MLYSPFSETTPDQVCGGGWVKLPEPSDATPEGIELERAEFDRATRLPQRLAELVAGLSTAPDSLAAATAKLVELSLASEAGDAATAEAARETWVRTALSTRDAKATRNKSTRGRAP